MGDLFIKHQHLKEFCSSVFQKLGLDENSAHTVADNLIEAELRGVRSHGIAKVKDYVKFLEEGIFNPNPNIRIVKEDISILSIDGDFGMGSVTGKYAMEKCIEKAKTTGIACATVFNGTHFGMAAYYSMLALDNNMIGIALCNSGNIMTVYGGISRALGTNPISVAVPANKELPVVFDAATSEAAFNKILFSHIAGKDIPLGWAVDKDGNPTTKAKDALEGAVVPFGGYKGSGLAIIVNILSGVLNGAFLQGKKDSAIKGEHSNGVGFFFSAIDIEKFLDINLFKNSIDLFVKDLKSSKLDKHIEKIYMPGELEYLRKEENLENGILLVDGVLNDLKEIQLKYLPKFNLEDYLIS